VWELLIFFIRFSALDRAAINDARYGFQPTKIIFEDVPRLARLPISSGFEIVNELAFSLKFGLAYLSGAKSPCRELDIDAFRELLCPSTKIYYR